MRKRNQVVLTAVGREQDRTPAATAEPIPRILERAGVRFDGGDAILDTLPFSLNDVTAGSESELQAVVTGSRERVDLPLVIEESNYFANMMRRADAGEFPRRVVTDLERFLANNPSGIWENSWVRFPRSRLSPFAQEVLERDLLADKRDPARGQRGDAGRFFCRDASGGEMLRVPISYLIKLSLADLIGSQPHLPEMVRKTGIRLMEHYLNDNSSPETFSFNVVPLRPSLGMGRAIARETGIRFLMSQFLIRYANLLFGLEEQGQSAMTYFAPHPPVRQKELNDLVSDSFYRELFMSPCLSGWDRGETKHRYMQLCHQVLSRSQLNAVAKLRDAGIITNNLVVLPNLSNISLANNGTHISLGSRRIGRAMIDPENGFNALHEKRLGDLVIKISEHFLPLFVGTYSAAPYRLAFSDFHPEQALGFLPHELDYTHLRMLWRRWRKKADLSVFGRSLTPFGPEGFDRLISSLFALRGDFVPDYRLIDYLACLLSTDRSPALNGELGSCDRLRRDLADMGVFDEQMSLYLLYKLREHGKMGFSGFEGRYYSLFETFDADMGRAADLQNLITALAYLYLAQGMDHRHIPDTPHLESERRQIFFGAAIGIPTFFVHRDSPNLFLKKILDLTERTRPSRRYPDYLRVYNHEYRLALLRLMREEGAGLVERLGLGETLDDLEERLTNPGESALGRLTGGILTELNAPSPLDVESRDFNCAAEQYYRTTLRRRQMTEAYGFLEASCRMMELDAARRGGELRQALAMIAGERQCGELLRRAKRDLLEERGDGATLRQIMNLLLLSVYHEERRFADHITTRSESIDVAPVHRAG
jgi:hypothetical protein